MKSTSNRIERAKQSSQCTALPPTTMWTRYSTVPYHHNNPIFVIGMRASWASLEGSLIQTGRGGPPVSADSRLVHASLGGIMMALVMMLKA